MELWGGAECTVNRVDDEYRDQLLETGHADRLDDLARVAALGITAFRQPVLWERVAPDRPDACDWRWSDARIAELDRLGIRPIVGLLHHGSGPRYTSLVDDGFPTLFCAYAAAAARRYPDVRDWTPINEPLTTARFSGLYGAWYPHARDTATFWQALLNEVEGTIAAMAAIREVHPGARLIQTDDLGETIDTGGTAAVTGYYNARRWLGWDLLCGRVRPEHPLWEEGARLGFADRLRRIADAPCPPDIIGINHYPTSDRALVSDAGAPLGYRDAEGLRICDPAPGGLRAAMTQCWERYRLPIVITECHLGCTREEQLRWVRRSWDTAIELASSGVDVRAVTAWAMFGSVDWTSLLTERRGEYEEGAFDARGPVPRPTAVATLLASLTDRRPMPAAIDALARLPGWWERPERLGQAALAEQVSDVPPVLITGATGTLGQAFAGACILRGLPYVLTDRAQLPLDDEVAIRRMLDTLKPWAVINAAGYVRVDDAEGDEALCHAANAEGAVRLARACAERNIHCTLFSSDLVFSGDHVGLVEDAPLDPCNAYGRSKAAMEREAATLQEQPLVVRTAAFFSPFDPHNFAAAVERELGGERDFAASAAHVVTPTYVPDLVRVTLDLVIDGERGTWHLTNGDAVSWHGFAVAVADALQLPAERVGEADPVSLGWRAPRPTAVPLTSNRGRQLPPLRDAIARHAAERRRRG